MKKLIFAGIAGVFLLSGCSAMEGQMGKTYDSFKDDHGRYCTSLKWGDSSSLDCDFKPDAESSNG